MSCEPTSVDELTPRDEDHLRALAIFYTILLVFEGLVLAWGTFVFSASEAAARPEVAAYLGVIGATLLGSCALHALTVRNLRRRQGRWLICLNAALLCFGFPFGTLLGGLTFVVLLRPSVRRSFRP